ncbi:MAG: hypothetical protein AAGE01_20055 [Pseudomonadota bacterium]
MIEELLDGLFGRFFLAVLRVLKFLAWDLCFEYVGWTIGWCFLRLITLGRYPTQRLGGVDQAPWHVALFVELLGLAILGALVLAMTGMI